MLFVPLALPEVGCKLNQPLPHLLALVTIALLSVAPVSAASTSRPPLIGSAQPPTVDAPAVPFNLLQSLSRHRFAVCVVHYDFDRPLDESLVVDRLRALTEVSPARRATISILHGRPYRLNADRDQPGRLIRLLPHDDPASILSRQTAALSQLPTAEPATSLFRTILSADARRLTFMWNPVLSDLESMLDMHVHKLFLADAEPATSGHHSAIPADAQNAAGEAKAEAIREASTLRLTFSEQPARSEGSSLADSDSMRPDPNGMFFIRDSSADWPAVDVTLPGPLGNIALAATSGEPATSAVHPLGEYLTRKMTILAPRVPLRQPPWPDYVSAYIPLTSPSLHLGDAMLIGHQLRMPRNP